MSKFLAVRLFSLEMALCNVQAFNIATRFVYVVLLKLVAVIFICCNVTIETRYHVILQYECKIQFALNICVIYFP